MYTRLLISIFIVSILALISISCSGQTKTDPIRAISGFDQEMSSDTLSISHPDNILVHGEFSHSLTFEWSESGLSVINHGDTIYDLIIENETDNYSFGIIERGMKTASLDVSLKDGDNLFTIDYKEAPYHKSSRHIIHTDGFHFDHAVINGENDGYMANEVLFGFIDGVSEYDRHRIIRDNNLFLTGINTTIGMHKGRFDDGRDPQDVVDQLKQEPLVRSPGLNGLVRNTSWPNDPVWKDSWPDAYRWSMQRIDAHRAWDIYTDGVLDGDGDASVENIVLAIADTGVHPHPDLGLDEWDKWIAYNFSKNFDSPGVVAYDAYGHGTSVAGIAGALGNNEYGLAGVAWNAHFISIKCLSDWGWGSWEVIGNAISYIGELADEYPFVKIIGNFSLGGWGYDEWCEQASAYSDQFPNTLLIAAAGNNSWETAFYPASYNGFYSIGASSIFQEEVDGELLDKEVSGECPFGWGTNWHENIWVSAPGSAAITTIHIPWSIMYDYEDPDCPPMSCPGWFCQYFSGTSAATPHVSGLAALLWNKYPDWTKQEVMEKIRDTADPMSLPPEKEGKLGSGRINAYRALTE